MIEMELLEALGIFLLCAGGLFAMLMLGLMIFAACFAVHNKEQNTTDWHRVFLTRAAFDEWIEEVNEADGEKREER